MSDASVTLVPPPPYKDRRGWLIAFGIVEILIGCFLLLMIAFSVFALSRAPQPAAQPVNAKAGMVMAAVMYGAAAIVFVAIGIGSVQARRWARIAMLVVGWCWLAIGVLATAMIAVMAPMIMKGALGQSPTPPPASAQPIIMGVMLGFMALFFILLPVIFIVFYSGKNVKATCENIAGGAPAGIRKPIPVVVIAVWFGVSALSCLAIVFVHTGYPLFGYVLNGWAGRAAMILMSAGSAWLSWNLYRQRETAWRVAVAWLVFGWASMIVTQARLGLAGMYRQMGYAEAEVARMVPVVSYAMYVAWLSGAAFFIFLLLIRKHFTTHPAVVGN